MRRRVCGIAQQSLYCNVHGALLCYGIDHQARYRASTPRGPEYAVRACRNVQKTLAANRPRGKPASIVGEPSRGFRKPDQPCAPVRSRQNNRSSNSGPVHQKKAWEGVLGRVHRLMDHNRFGLASSVRSVREQQRASYSWRYLSRSHGATDLVEPPGRDGGISGLKRARRDHGSNAL